MSSNRWSSSFAFIVAATGAAVGLGSIWKFPYMVANNGGGVFVVLFLLALLFLGIPAMMGEILIGKLGRANPVSTLNNLAIENQHSPHWRWLGWWGALGLLLVLSFYSVVSGWSIAYTLKAWSGMLRTLDPQGINALWTDFLADPTELLGWHTLFIGLTLWVVAQGVQSGLELASKIMMPGLFLILIFLVFYSCSVGNAKEAFQFLFFPDFSKISVSMGLDAIGQALFSLAIGAGAMLIYGAYLPKKTHIGPTVFAVALLTVAVALMAGLAIFPILFANNLPLESGPGLMFQVLPLAFTQMPYGSMIGSLFFLLLWFAAWTSSISMAEPLVVLLIERRGLTRTLASWIIGLFAWGLGTCAMFSFNLWSNVTVFGLTLFEIIVFCATNIILPIGALGFCWFAGHVLTQQASTAGLQLKHSLAYFLWRGLMRFVIPAMIVVVFLTQIF